MRCSWISFLILLCSSVSTSTNMRHNEEEKKRETGSCIFSHNSFDYTAHTHTHIQVQMDSPFAWEKWLTEKENHICCFVFECVCVCEVMLVFVFMLLHQVERSLCLSRAFYTLRSSRSISRLRFHSRTFVRFIFNKLLVTIYRIAHIHILHQIICFSHRPAFDRDKVETTKWFFEAMSKTKHVRLSVVHMCRYVFWTKYLFVSYRRRKHYSVVCSLQSLFNLILLRLSLWQLSLIRLLYVVSLLIYWHIHLRNHCVRTTAVRYTRPTA